MDKELPVIFQLIDSVSFTKQDMLTEENEHEYSPYLVNKMLSLHKDCVFYVCELSKYPWLEKRTHYEFLMESLRKRKRYGRKMPKPLDDEKLNVIKEYYGVSTKVAREYYPLVDEAQLVKMRARLEKGG